MKPFPKEKISDASPRPGYRAIFLVALVLALVFLVYAGSLFYPLTDWDDPLYIIANPLITSFSPSHLTTLFTKPHFCLYIPFTLLSYALDYQFFRYDAFGYHLTNLLLHLANVSLVYGLIAFLTGESLAALGAALLFGIHPVQVESVVWIAERKNVLSSYFFLLAFVFYVLSKHRPRVKTMLLASWLAFFAACFSKPNVVIFPLLVLAFDFCTGDFKKEKMARYIPLLLGTFAFAAVTVGITRDEGILTYYGGSFMATARAMMAVMVKYFELLFLPLRLSLNYEFWIRSSLAYRYLYIPILFFMLSAAGLVWLFFKDRKLFFWGCWYLILLLPVMNFVPFPSLMNDRYLYLPMIGIFTLLFVLLKRYAGVGVTTGVIFISAVACAFLNFHRQDTWSSRLHVWVETGWSRAKTPGWESLKERLVKQGENSEIYQAQQELFEKHEVNKAIQRFQKVLEQSRDPEAYDGLGIAYAQKGDMERAIYYFRKAIEVNPREAAFHGNLAAAYVQDKELQSAMNEFLKAIALDPRDPVHHSNFAALLAGIGNPAAGKEFLEAVRLAPDSAEALFNAGFYYHQRKQFGEARKYWAHLLELYPNHENAAYIKAQFVASENKNPVSTA